MLKYLFYLWKEVHRLIQGRWSVQHYNGKMERVATDDVLCLRQTNPVYLLEVAKRDGFTSIAILLPTLWEGGLLCPYRSTGLSTRDQQCVRCN